MKASARIRHGLVLTGGGARAAYQVGMLRAIAEITKYKQIPFKVISGISAGAINGAWLASHCDHFDLATKSMWDQWASLRAEDVFRTDVTSLTTIAMRWLKDRSLGGLEKKQITYLLDTSPLHQFIRNQIDFKALNRHLCSEKLYGFSVTAANYHTGHSTAFYLGSPEIKSWQRLNRIAIRSQITADHILASASIPIFFPPVQIGDAFYGDGMVRMNAPLSAAIHMNPDRLMVIGVRGPTATAQPVHDEMRTISLGEIAGTVLNGLFFDSLDADLARMERINRTLAIMTKEELKRHPDQLRHIPILTLKPSREAADMSYGEISNLPITLRYLLRGIGLTKEKGTDLLSYLSFEPKYLQSLLELGYEDGFNHKAEILDFFEMPAEEGLEWIQSPGQFIR